MVHLWSQAHIRKLMVDTHVNMGSAPCWVYVAQQYRHTLADISNLSSDIWSYSSRGYVRTLCVCVLRTFGGASEPGYSLWSSLFQRCISLMTMGLLKSTSWKPVTLAPPCMKRSKLMSLKPFSRWGRGVREGARDRVGWAGVGGSKRAVSAQVQNQSQNRPDRRC